MTKQIALVFLMMVCVGCRQDVPEHFLRGYDQCLLTKIENDMITYKCETYKEPTR